MENGKAAQQWLCSSVMPGRIASAMEALGSRFALTRTPAGERARGESQEEWGMAGAERGGEEQPGTVIVPRMLEGQKRRIFGVRGRQGARIYEQAS
jgi:hypothetical protein